MAYPHAVLPVAPAASLNVYEKKRQPVKWQVRRRRHRGIPGHRLQPLHQQDREEIGANHKPVVQAPMVHAPTSLELAHQLYGGWGLSPPSRRPGRVSPLHEGIRISPDPDPVQSLEQNQTPDEASRAHSDILAEPPQAVVDLGKQETSSSIYSARSVIRCRGDSTGDLGLDSDIEGEGDFVDRGLAMSWAQGVVAGGLIDYAREIGDDACVLATSTASSSGSWRAREKEVGEVRKRALGSLRLQLAGEMKSDEVRKTALAALLCAADDGSLRLKLAAQMESYVQAKARELAEEKDHREKLAALEEELSRLRRENAALKNNQEGRVSPASPQPVPPRRPSRRDQSPLPPQAMAPRSRGAAAPAAQPRSAGGRGNHGVGGIGSPTRLMPTLDDLLLHGGMRAIPPVPVRSPSPTQAKAPMRSARVLPQRRLPRLEVSERRPIPQTAR